MPSPTLAKLRFALGGEGTFKSTALAATYEERNFCR